jgi:hypothetical protein
MTTTNLLRPLVTFALLLAGCTPKFENATTLVDLRLLAVQAEPPEVLIDIQTVAATGTLPEPLPEISLVPLIVDPNGGGRPVSLKVAICPNRTDESFGSNQMRGGRVSDTVGDSPCGEGALVIADATAVAGPDGVVPFRTSFTPTLPFLIAAAEADPLGIELGLPITVTFTVRAGEESVIAVKRLLFSPRLTPAQTPNRNPIVTKFLWRSGREEPPKEVDPNLPPVVARGGRLRIRVAPAEAESYPARNFSAAERRFYTEQIPEETLRYHFFTTRGVFTPASVNNDPSPLRTNPTVNLETTYEAPADVPGPYTAEVFVVVRDERGGASWARTLIRVE